MADKPAGSTRLDDHKPAQRFEPRPPKWLRPIRDRVRCVPGGAMIWKLLIGTIGGIIVVIGLLLIPLPGPGWALVFVGLAVWATEFHWAYRLLRFGRRVLRDWTAWAKRQSLLIRLLLGLLGLLVLAAAAYVGWQTLR
ncbi:MAG TPA: TIGR02611 family protein [Jatrophihabitans sp.]|nr:TIGR02611 family protein [Jatrophihabitans sp.]